MQKVNEILGGIGGLVTTFDSKRIGVLLLILMCVLGFSGYLNYTFYNELIATKNKSVDAQIDDFKQYSIAINFCNKQRDSLFVINQTLKEQNTLLIKKK